MARRDRKIILDEKEILSLVKFVSAGILMRRSVNLRNEAFVGGLGNFIYSFFAKFGANNLIKFL